MNKTIITLTTDFGNQDGFVGAMKGVITTLAPSAQLIDIAHDIAPQNIIAGAFTLAQAASYFPKGTIHVAVVDPGVGSDRAALLIISEDQIFIGPDNGLLSLAIKQPSCIFHITEKKFHAHKIHPTFHGRDIFAVTAGQIAKGALPESVGPIKQTLISLKWIINSLSENILKGEIIHVDRFGNLITSFQEIKNLDFVSLKDDLIHIPHGKTYTDVAIGTPIAYLGSMGHLEIAIRNGSASQILQCAIGDPVLCYLKKRN